LDFWITHPRLELTTKIPNLFSCQAHPSGEAPWILVFGRVLS
jgi:hypothetical protein